MGNCFNAYNCDIESPFHQAATSSGKSSSTAKDSFELQGSKPAPAKAVIAPQPQEIIPDDEVSLQKRDYSKRQKHKSAIPDWALKKSASVNVDQDDSENESEKEASFAGQLALMRRFYSWNEIPLDFFVDTHLNEESEEKKKKHVMNKLSKAIHHAPMKSDYANLA